MRYFLKQNAFFELQYLLQSLIEYWVHSLSDVVSMKSLSSEMLRKVTAMNIKYISIRKNIPGSIHKVSEVAIVGSIIQHSIPVKDSK